MLIVRLNVTMHQTRVSKHGTHAYTPGFTIVELLIVIVVIGILAAITIVSFNGIQNRANDTAVQSDLQNIGTQIVRYNIEKGVFPTSSSLTDLSTIAFKVSQKSYGNHIISGGGAYNLLYCLKGLSDDFALVASSAGKNTYVYNSGAVRTFTGSWSVGWGTVCPAAFTPNDGSATGAWIYSNGTWPSWSS